MLECSLEDDGNPRLQRTSWHVHDGGSRSREKIAALRRAAEEARKRIRQEGGKVGDLHHMHGHELPAERSISERRNNPIVSAGLREGRPSLERIPVGLDEICLLSCTAKHTEYSERKGELKDEMETGSQSPRRSIDKLFSLSKSAGGFGDRRPAPNEEEDT